MPSAPKAPATPQAAGSARRETAIVFATHAWNLIAGLVIQSTLAWVLAPAGRGSFAVCVALGSVLGVLFTPGTDSASQYYVMSGKMSPSEGVSVAIIHAVLSSLLGIVAGLILLESELPYMQRASTTAFLVALPLIAASLLSTTLELQLAGLRKFSELGTASVLRSAANVGALILFVAVLDGGVEGAVLAFTCSQFVHAGYNAWALFARHGVRFTFNVGPSIRATLPYGLRFYVARLGNAVEISLGTMALASLANATEVGLFAAASAIMLRLQLGAESLVSMLAPRVAGDPRGRPQLVATCARVAFTSTAVAGLFLGLLGEPLIDILLSPRFRPALELIWILVPAMAAYALSTILLTYFRGTGRPGICSHAVWISLLCNVAFVVISYPHLGLTAPAWGMVVGFSARAVVLIIAFWRQAETQWNLFVPGPRDVASLLGNPGHVRLE